jgi:hypothetical protein
MWTSSGLFAATQLESSFPKNIRRSLLKGRIRRAIPIRDQARVHRSGCRGQRCNDASPAAATEIYDDGPGVTTK